MTIEYVEIRDANRSIIGIIDTMQSLIWHTTYRSVGDFEIYAQATPRHIELLAEGNYVTRIDNDEVGIIENISFTFTPQNGRMIIASGRFAKSILDRRHIYKLSGNTNNPTILSGKVEVAIRSLVSNNAINCSFDSKRNIAALELGELANLTEIIVDENGNAAEKQVSFDNLLEYTDSVLDEYDLSAKIILSDAKKLQYIVYKGANRSTDNTEGNAPIIFSEEFDNLLESNYALLTESEKNVALVGGEGEGLDRFYSLVAGTETDLNRRETFIDASSISKKYKDEKDVEKTYTDAEYVKLLNSQGKQSLAEMQKVETFRGSINITNGQFVFNRDFSLGDIVTIQDNSIGKYTNSRIMEATEAQDENGYSVTIDFE